MEVPRGEHVMRCSSSEQTHKDLELVDPMPGVNYMANAGKTPATTLPKCDL